MGVLPEPATLQPKSKSPFVVYLSARLQECPSCHPQRLFCADERNFSSDVDAGGEHEVVDALSKLAWQCEEVTRGRLLDLVP